MVLYKKCQSNVNIHQMLFTYLFFFFQLDMQLNDVDRSIIFESDQDMIHHLNFICVLSNFDEEQVRRVPLTMPSIIFLPNTVFCSSCSLHCAVVFTLFSHNFICTFTLQVKDETLLVHHHSVFHGFQIISVLLLNTIHAHILQVIGNCAFFVFPLEWVQFLKYLFTIITVRSLSLLLFSLLSLSQQPTPCWPYRYLSSCYAYSWRVTSFLLLPLFCLQSSSRGMQGGGPFLNEHCHPQNSNHPSKNAPPLNSSSRLKHTKVTIGELQFQMEEEIVSQQHHLSSFTISVIENSGDDIEPPPVKPLVGDPFMCDCPLSGRSV